MNSRLIVSMFDKWRAQSLPMALVTVYETAGSTYSKAGHRILIAATGDHQGLVSGGCLEGDLAERARGVIDSGTPQCVTYDLRDEADELFGLGVGCNGLLRVLVQPLTAGSGYEPFASIVDCMLGTQSGCVATVIASDDPRVAAGATLVHVAGKSRNCGIPAELEPLLTARCADRGDGPPAVLETIEPGLDVLVATLTPVPRLLLLGGGLDAVPLVNMASELGWRVTVADHRPAYIERRSFAAAESTCLVDPTDLGSAVDIDVFDAVVVMSHHLVTDERYLRELARHGNAYLGVLGPRARRQRILDALGAECGALAGRLRGPVGLDIGADSPESIALSILAEIQQVLSSQGAVRDAELRTVRA